MNNTEKLLRAFIEASGYEIEEVTVNTPTRTISHFDVNNDGLPVFIDSLEPIIDYKVAKKKVQVCFDINGPEWSCIVDYILHHSGDIEAETNDFDILKPMLDYFNRNCTRASKSEFEGG